MSFGAAYGAEEICGRVRTDTMLYNISDIDVGH